jgi:hypothetical protein
MRTTLTIDDDLLAAAHNLARARSVSVGRILSDWARRGLTTPSQLGAASESGFPVFRVPVDAHPITNDDVKTIEDEM